MHRSVIAIMISVDALLRLVTVKEELEDPQVIQKIRQILRPKEYTKVDEIIDLVFSAAEDVKKEETFQLEVDASEQLGKKSTAPVNFREQCIARIQTLLKTVLIKRSAALFSSGDEQIGVICVNSRQHQLGKHSSYWFAFHPHQKEAISKYPKGYVAFGCGSAEKIIFVPAKEFITWLNKFWTTETDDRMYWHVRIKEESSGFHADTKAGHEAIDVTPFLMH
ncbi:MAG: hypothetical protein JWM16_1751 [Verrucomicrobiales bacterium]|nr:hypothetical protein [Verrucomicrobiales bacterium]